jgi:hypothetical protein
MVFCQSCNKFSYFFPEFLIFCNSLILEQSFTITLKSNQITRITEMKVDDNNNNIIVNNNTCNKLVE